jgi:hypothetical protein
MDPEYGKGQILVDLFEAIFESIAKFLDLQFKTPPHDIAGWVVNELKRKGK